MGVFTLYLIALLPVAVAAGIWVFNRSVVWWEWAVAVAIGLLTSGIMHAVAVFGMTSDIETWSGTVLSATRQPEWVSEHTYTTTDSKGNTTTHTYHVTHPERWWTDTTIGEIEISEDEYQKFVVWHGGNVRAIPGHRPFYDSGDRNDYVVDDERGFKQPCTRLKNWTNRIKAAPSVFSFREVPANIPVFDWPENPNAFRSGRLLGLTGDIDIRDFDRMNSRLGASKKVNLILVGFGNAGSEMGQWQRAKWLGGKKNDLVITYGGNPKKPTWAYVFGWTESDEVKQALQDLVLTQGVGKHVLSQMEKIVREKFVAKDWSKFDYISIEPQFRHYVYLILTMLVTQIGWWIYATTNRYTKDGNYGFRRFRY